MQYTLKKPCKHCPFRNDITPFLRRERVEEITDALLAGADFQCHKTIEYDDEDGEPLLPQPDTAQHCAGALIMLEHMEQPNQMMRIAERVGLYDRRKLDMNAPVFQDAEEMIDAQEI